MTVHQVSAGLAALYPGAGPFMLHEGRAGHAVVPEFVLGAAASSCSGASWLTPPPIMSLPAGITIAGVVIVRCRPEAEKPAPHCADFEQGIGLLRLGLSRALLAEVTGFARKRIVADGPLVNQQLIRGALADASIELMTAEVVLLDDPDADELADVHAALTLTDRSLLRLLGAAGFESDGVAGVSYFSELLAEVYGGARHAGA